ncbi:MAG: YafY family transcriptional regulator [Brucellaceae bacterium]|jgi:predicted DNA-binding transcriptional regulator YafY|nr:YafY family transcriptional regulator [Brucellaceae bacterium]
MRTFRLFTLLDHLRGKTEPVSAEKLAQELQVSTRTIYRDMATLQAMGAPVRGEAGMGYQLEKGYFLPPLHFDPDELDALMLGTRLIAARGDDALAAAARRVTAKISAAIGHDDGENYARLPLRAATRQSTEHEKAATHLAQLRQAIRDRAVLDISYSDLQDKRSRRNVRPLGLTVFDTVWLLTVWCENKNDFRNLRADRIEDIQPAGRLFKPERGKRFEDYLKTLS